MGIFSRRNLQIALILSVIVFGLFLRAYHFSEWLHFELDQARDARVIDAVFDDGIGELPLLGPKAGGTFLRLAPGYYYLQYVSGLLFGETPTGIAVIVMVLSVASIGVFYLFVRRYFTFGIALAVSVLFSVSAFFVMYGRFAWNPNILPFFILFGMYALLRAVDKDGTNRERWFLGAVFALTLATHAHFLAFVAVPTIAVLFLLFKRPRFSVRSWAGAVLIVVLLYLPMVLNEIETKGMNTEEFFGAITEKSTKEDHTVIDKLFRNSAEHALGALVITTGFEGGTFPSITWSQGRIWWTCAEKCDQGKWYGVSAGLFLGSSVLLLSFFWWRESVVTKRDFLLLVGIWLGVTFVLFLPLSYGFAPRFFLLSGMLFFVLLGLIFVGVRQLFGRVLGTVVVAAATSLLVASQLYFLTGRFDQLSRADSEIVKNAPDRILKERIRVTLGQQEQIVDFLEARSEENDYPVYMFSEPQHRRALKYLMERRGIENAVLGFDGVYTEGVYFLVLRAQSDLEDALKKYKTSYGVGTMTSFGTLVVIELFPKPEAIIGKRQDFTLPKPSDSKAPPRYTWKELWDRNTGASETVDEGTLEQQEDAEADKSN